MKKLIILLLLVAGLLAGCQKQATPGKEPFKPAPGAQEVLFWYAMSGPLGEALNDLVDEFNRTHPDIYINTVSMGNYTALSQKMMASIQTGTQPDIVQVFESWTANVASEGLLVSMSKLIEEDPNFGQEDLDDIYPVFINSNTMGGTLWSMPFNKSVRVMYYNGDMLFLNGMDPYNPPSTWDEFRTTCRKLTKDTDGDGTPDVYGTTLAVSAWQFENLLLQAGGEIMNDDYTVPLFNSQYGLEAVGFLNGLLNEDKSAYLSTGYSGQDDFLAGKVAFVEGSSVSMAFMQKKGIDFYVGTGAIPVYRNGRSLISGTNIAIFDKKNTKKQKAAWEFVKWFISSPVTARWASMTYYMPVRRSAFEQPVLAQRLANHPEERAVFAQLEQASFEPPIKEWYKARKVIEEKVLERVLRGTIEPAVALDEAAAELQTELKNKDEE